MLSLKLSKILNMHDPFFIFYDARSGSTYFAKCLVERAKACIPPETNFVTSIISQYGTTDITSKSDIQVLCDIIRRDRKFSDWQLNIKEIQSHIEEQLKLNQKLSLRDFFGIILRLYGKQFENDKFTRFGFKKGSYISFFQELKEIFPNTKFIHLIRDGRAVFNSKKHNVYSVTGKPFETNPSQAAQTWKQTIKLSRQIDNLYPEDSLIIHYEKLIENPDLNLNKVVDFLNLNPVKSVYLHEYQVPDRYGILHKNIKKQPLKSRMDSWKTSLKLQEIEQYEAIAGKTLKQEGYYLHSNFYKRLFRISSLK